MSNTLDMLAKIANPASQMAGKGAKALGGLITSDYGTMSPVQTGDALKELIGLLAKMQSPELQEGNVKQKTARLPALGIPAIAGQVATSGDPGVAPQPQANAQSTNGSLTDAQIAQGEEAKTFQQMEIEAYEKAAQSALNTTAKEAVAELGPETVLNEATKVKQEPNQSPSQSPEDIKRNPVMNLLMKMIGPGSTLESLGSGGARRALQREQAATIRQERETGMTAADREKLQTTNLFNLVKSGQKEPSPEERKLLQNTRTGIEQTQLLIDSFMKDPNLFKSTGKFGARGQQVAFIRKNLSDTIGRLRSGGAINDEESKTFQSFFPEQGPIKGRIEDPKTVMFKLRTMNNFFKGIEQGTTSSSNAAFMAAKVQKALDQGHSIEDISKFIGI